MRSTSILVCTFVYILMGLFSGDANLEAQELKKFLRDYRDGRIYNYSPHDPNFRGKVFLVHTKHYGAFYNCDGEENKRNSPYVCWKPHHERVFPPRLGFWENLRRDIAEVKQRINDGGCGACPANCTCATCQQAKQGQPVVQNNCNCAECSAARTQYIQEGNIGIPPQEGSFGIPLQEGNTEILPLDSSPGFNGEILPGEFSYMRQQGSKGLSAQAPGMARKELSSKYGLVSGKILQPENASWESHAAVTPQTSTAVSKVASNPEANSLLQAKQKQAEIRQAQIKSRGNGKLDLLNSLIRR